MRKVRYDKYGDLIGSNRVQVAGGFIKKEFLSLRQCCSDNVRWCELVQRID